MSTHMRKAVKDAVYSDYDLHGVALSSINAPDELIVISQDGVCQMFVPAERVKRLEAKLTEVTRLAATWSEQCP